MDRYAGTTASESVHRALATARRAYGADWTPDRVAIAPGRIELLGNHIDYNGGPVLAAAIDRFIVVAAASDAGSAQTVRAIAADTPASTAATIQAEPLAGWSNPSPPPDWQDYVRGLLAAALDRQAATPGTRGTTLLPASMAIAGDIPIGFGLSSSAALCVGLALAMVSDITSSTELVLLAQAAEHRAGTPCGAMDQSASAAGGVVAFNGATLAVEPLSPSLGDLVFVVADSGVDRSLSTSSYPVRVAESAAALNLARAALGREIPYLAAITASELDDLGHQRSLPDHLLRRVRHVVEETGRVHEGRDAIMAADWKRFGALMTASGSSSAQLYEISHPRVEELVAEALTVDGVLGARMMGGGEGGTALILLPRPRVSSLQSTLFSGYFRRNPLAAARSPIHVCAFAPGAALIAEGEPGSLR